MKNIVEQIVNSKKNIIDKDKSKSKINGRKSVNLKSINFLKKLDDRNGKRRKSKDIKSKVFKNKLNELKDKFELKDEKSEKNKITETKEKTDKIFLPENNNYNKNDKEKELL